MMMRARFLLPLLLLAAPALAQFGPLVESAPQRAGMVAAHGTQQMVAAANPLAAAAGKQILDQGGSAMDAVIAMQLVLTLVEPQSSGIGGGGFVLHFDAKHSRLTSLDGRETAPAAARDTLFLGADGKPVSLIEAYQGGRAVGVPGMVALMVQAHKTQGKLPWKALFVPAIKLARDGFAVSPRLSGMLVNAQSLIDKFPATKANFTSVDGKTFAAGAAYQNKAYAATLENIARKGPTAFYRGANAQAIVDAVHSSPISPATLSLKDLRDYKVVARAPLCGSYRSYKVCSMGPPSSGAIANLQALKLLETYDLKAMGPMSADAIHLIAESLAIAFADREQYLADPAFIDVPAEGLLDTAYLKSRAPLLDISKAGGPYAAGDPPRKSKSALAPNLNKDVPSTSHMVAADRFGNVATWTGTVQAPFGSFLLVGGYMLNNQLTDFSFLPSREGKPVANRVEPGKRPRSSMSPTIVFDSQGRVVMALGSAGGSRIIAHVLKVLIAHLDWGMDIQQAIDYPNFFKSGQGLELEPGLVAAAARPGLEAKGQKVSERPNVSGLSGLTISYATDGSRTLKGGADSRREGIALAD
jgi:gamma-glutamyltranspeptidase / glutathione hydrolase